MPSSLVMGLAPVHAFSFQILNHLALEEMERLRADAPTGEFGVMNLTDQTPQGILFLAGHGLLRKPVEELKVRKMPFPNLITVGQVLT